MQWLILSTNDMKAKCIINSGKSLSKKQISLGNSTEYTREYLEIGEIYTVYGIMIIVGTINYLVSYGLANSPAFEPAEFFKIVEHTLPSQWYYSYYGEAVVEAIWGYKELALDAQHNIQLTEGETAAMKIFYNRKNEIDKENL
jgi:hypothetical protein